MPRIDEKTDTAPPAPDVVSRPESGGAWSFVPVLYFLQGVPYMIVTGMSALLFKSFALDQNLTWLDNDVIAFWTTLVALPWTLKPLWSPLVDLTLTKRRWILLTQALILVALAALAFAIQMPAFFPATMAVFGAIALLSATHDVAADGFYLLALDKAKQAMFVGVRSTFFRLSTLFVTGGLIYLAGQFEKVTRENFVLISEPGKPDRRELLSSFQERLQRIDIWAEELIANDIARAWVLAIGAGMAVYGVLLLVNAFLLPRPVLDRTRRKVGPASLAQPPLQPDPNVDAAEPEPRIPFVEAIVSFFRQEKILWILLFILFYRFSESLIGKIAPLFLKDPEAKGGLGLDTDTIGVISGTYGVLALLAGGLLGGLLISRYGIKRCFWPMVLAMNVPNLFYVAAAVMTPNLTGVTALVVVDQFGYGFGFSAYMVYLMFVSQGTTRYQTSNYAVATGLMALGVMVAGMISGMIQVQLGGYLQFFIAVVLLGIPGMITLFFIPMDRQDIKQAQIDLD